MKKFKNAVEMNTEEFRYHISQILEKKLKIIKGLSVDSVEVSNECREERVLTLTKIKGFTTDSRGYVVKVELEIFGEVLNDYEND